MPVAGIRMHVGKPLGGPIHLWRVLALGRCGVDGLHALGERLTGVALSVGQRIDAPFEISAPRTVAAVSTWADGLLVECPLAVALEPDLRGRIVAAVEGQLSLARRSLTVAIGALLEQTIPLDREARERLIRPLCFTPEAVAELGLDELDLDRTGIPRPVDLSVRFEKDVREGIDRQRTYAVRYREAAGQPEDNVVTLRFSPLSARSQPHLLLHTRPSRKALSALVSALSHAAAG